MLSWRAFMTVPLAHFDLKTYQLFINALVRLFLSDPHHIGCGQFLTGSPPYEIIEIKMISWSAGMAGNLHVRNLDDDLIARLKRRAARHGRSAEAEHREILRQALIGDVEPSFETLAADLRKLTRRRKQTPSEVFLRQGRQER